MYEYDPDNLIRLLNEYADGKLKEYIKIFICNQNGKYHIPMLDVFFEENKYKLKLSCSCKIEEVLSFQDAFNDLVKDFDRIGNYENCFRCKRTGHDNNEYKYYCKKCKKHLCTLCISKFKICPHKGNDLFMLQSEYQKYISIGESLQNKLNNLISIDNYIPKLFNVIFDNFKKYIYNYSYYYIINKFNDIFKNGNN